MKTLTQTKTYKDAVLTGLPVIVASDQWAMIFLIRRGKRNMEGEHDRLLNNDTERVWPI